MEAAVVVTEFGAGTAKVITMAELATFMKSVAADANADPKFLRTSYGRCGNGNSRERCKCKAKLSHLLSLFVAALYRKQWNQQFVPSGFNEQTFTLRLRPR